MKRTFVNLVQKCICTDFLLNSLIDLNSYKYTSFLYNIKNENIRNIKIIYNLYKYNFFDNFPLIESTNIKIDKNNKNIFKHILNINLGIISDLNNIKSHNLDPYSVQIINILLSKYFNLYSFVQCYLFKNLNINRSINKKNFRFFYLVNEYNTENNYDDLLRNVCIDAINLFFEYSLIDNPISDEQYDIFYENNDDKCFYQFFFKSNDRVFKVRILYKTSTIFYIYQYIENSMYISPSLNENDALAICNNYLKNKFKNLYENLIYDNRYSNPENYLGSTENYKFKYNYKDNTNKIDLNKGIYITVDTKIANIIEIESS